MALASLYIHIPYCLQKCHYCDFYSLRDQSTLRAFLGQVPKQVETLWKDYPLEGLGTIYLGGGTPGLVSPPLLKILLESFLPLQREKKEVTLECNPSNISPEAVEAWKEMGITRISLGVQTFQKGVLNRLGREGKPEDILRGISIIQERSAMDLSVDLIQGLPGMEPLEGLADLQQAIKLGVDHLSWYSLTVEEGTVLGKRGYTPPEVDEVWEKGCRLLQEAGYERYEVSNFARNGKESEHNKGYWQMEPFMGCGPSAVSMLPHRGGDLHRFKTEAELIRYSQGEFRYSEYEILSPLEQLKDLLLMGLRLKKGIPLETFQGKFSRSPQELFPQTLETWIASGELLMDESLRPSHRGMDRLNPILISLYRELEGFPPGMKD